jgi:hypothetical protein
MKVESMNTGLNVFILGGYTPQFTCLSLQEVLSVCLIYVKLFKIDLKEQVMVAQLNDATDVEACIQVCLDCARACRDCTTANCQAVTTDMTECIRICRDCADVSALCARLLARDSEVGVEFCQVCATICELCSQKCAQYPYAHCHACSVAARNCAKLCGVTASAYLSNAF